MSSVESSINRELLNYRQLENTLDELRQQMSSSKKISDSKDDPIGWSKATKDRFEYQSRQTTNDTLTEVARNITVADLSMEAIGKHIQLMKAELQRVVTDYSSYPPGDPVRASILTSYMDLREMIDQLATPSGDVGAKKIMADPAIVAGAGDWTVPVDANSHYATIYSRQVHTGSTGLDIPALNINAADPEIEAAIASLDAATGILAVRRSSLAGDGSGITQAQAVNKAIAATTQQTAETLENADTNEIAVEATSEENRYQLALAALKGMLDVYALSWQPLGE